MGDSMLDICLLGTGGMLPMPRRWLTSMMARCDGTDLLIDCGEGTQIAMKEKGWSPKPIDIICFTHYHADHISGLPGLLLSMGNSEKTSPLTLIGPKGLEKVVNCLRIIAPELPFELRFLELGEARQKIHAGPYVIDAFKVNHNIPCYGYSVSIPRAGKFDAAKAREIGIPLHFWGRLQKGETIKVHAGEDLTPPKASGKIPAIIADKDMEYTPDMVMGGDRKGLKVTYCTDTRPVPVIAEYAAGADLFICEGMYGEEDKEDKARGYKHMTMAEGAQLAAKAQPKRLWFTHYSPSLIRPDDYMDEIRKIFPEAKAARDGWSIDLGYEEDENGESLS